MDILPDVPWLVFDILQTQHLRDLIGRHSILQIHLVGKEQHWDLFAAHIWTQSAILVIASLCHLDMANVVLCVPSWFRRVSSSSLATTIRSLSPLSMTNMTAWLSLLSTRTDTFVL